MTNVGGSRLEQFEYLGDKVWVCVSPEHRFGTDAFLLSDFSAPRKKR